MDYPDFKSKAWQALLFPLQFFPEMPSRCLASIPRSPWSWAGWAGPQVLGCGGGGGGGEPGPFVVVAPGIAGVHQGDIESPELCV